MRTKTTLEPVCLIDSHYGIYIPQYLSELVKDGTLKVSGISDKSLNTILEDLKSPNNEHYWDSYDSLLNYTFTTIDGKEYYLYPDCDLWLIPEGLDIEDTFLS
jgi:hypothetical protein